MNRSMEEFLRGSMWTWLCGFYLSNAVWFVKMGVYDLAFFSLTSSIATGLVAYTIRTSQTSRGEAAPPKKKIKRTN